ncbi:toxin-antitoxin system HicB family antitoxin [Hyphomonas pacifica]|uniref:toxin-antitoxin system HicB family antitoxin n=1 Tax=Hyphomonas pacifica TaxID=1280941 RepID=UPI000DBFCF06|nr:toxin-antitoxin system HicB family antitoxin [Hyphomonas pacifica]RAN36963.1 hypothetical protein HY11_11140 [Hyphomonas pacifica]
MQTSHTSVLTIRPPNDRHGHLKILAAHRGVSLDGLFEAFATRAVAEFDAETRFRSRAACGDPQGGLGILDELSRRSDKKV